MANWFKKWLDKLAEENKKAFNGKRLDCCDLNSTSNKSSESQTAAGKK